MRKPLIVLWFGAGQDSTDLLLRYIYSRQFREQFVAGCHFILIMSDTGDEFDFTYRHVAEVRKLCLMHGIEFYFLTADQGYHSEAWQSLSGQYRRNHNIVSVAFPKTCTDNLKIQPNYRFLADYLRQRYGYDRPGKGVFYQYFEAFGRLQSMIGFSKGEESRCGQKAQYELFPESIKDQRPKWMQICIEHIYPLITLRVDRVGCQESIRSMGHKVPMPSNCTKCPFAAGPEIVFLHRFYLPIWNDWVQDEARKITKNEGKERNLGVKGEKLLPQVLEVELKKYGDWTDEMLIDYRMSHGHNIKSKIKLGRQSDRPGE